MPTELHWLACTRRRLVLLAWYPLFFMLWAHKHTHVGHGRAGWQVS